MSLLTVDDQPSSFTKNTAALGGAVYIAANAKGIQQTIQDATFTGNKAASDQNGKYGSGGAIYVSTTSDCFSGELDISRVEFIDNTADKYGGAVANYGKFSACGSSFKGNQARYGGAVMNAGFFYAEDASFSANAAVINAATGEGGNGGAIYGCCNKNMQDKQDNAGILQLSQLTFDSNTASNAGGAIDCVSGAFAYQIAGEEKFVNNSAGNIGGAIVLGTDGLVQIIPSFFGSFTFTGNTAKFAATVASTTTDWNIRNLATGFGFDYASLSTDQFEVFTRYSSNIPSRVITYDYIEELAGIQRVEGVPVYATVSYGSNSVELRPGDEVGFDELGVPSEGTSKIRFTFSDAPDVNYTLVVIAGGDTCASLRSVSLIGSSATAFSFTSYGKSFNSWSVDWREEGQSPETFTGLTTTCTPVHMYNDGLTEHTVEISVSYTDGTTGTYEYTLRGPGGSDALDNAFLDEELLNDLFAEELL